MAGSFYGGKAGAPFIIVCCYKTVSEMAQAFAKGVNYSTVQFDEYVLINTVDKNDPDNGRVYRRGYELTLLEDNPRKNDDPVDGVQQPAKRETGGGIYVGTIVGPAGHAPQVNFTTIDDVLRQQNEWNEETWDVRKGSGTYSVGNKHSYPGKYVDSSGNIAFNDNIQWSFISIRDTNNEDTNVYIGFKFPYLVVDYTAQTVSPYYHRSAEHTADFVNEDLITRMDIGDHAYYEKWHVDIPKGIKGDAFKNFRLVTNPEDYGIIQNYSNKAEDTSGINGVAGTPRQVLVYDYYHYDAEEDGEPVTLYLGDYNMISDIRFEDDGSFEIDYTHEDTDKWPTKVNWVKTVTLDSVTGVFKMTYNNATVPGANVDGGAAYQVQLRWVNSAEVLDDGSLKLSYTTGDPVITSNNQIKWITGIVMSNDGTITVSYNNNDADTVIEKAFTRVTDVRLTDEGQFTMEFNNDSVPTLTKNFTWMTNATLSDTGLLEVSFNNSLIPKLTKQLKWITNTTLADNGTLEFTFCNGEKITFNNKLKWIKNIKINSADDENKKISVQYNNDNDVWHDIGNPINYIERVAIRSEDAMLLVRYADPLVRGMIEYDGISGWTALESVRDYSGWLNGIILDSDNIVGLLNDDTAKQYLDSMYPNGLQGVNVATKTIAIRRPGLRTAIFAFDYNDAVNRKWQKLGYVESDAPQIICSKENDSTIEQKKEELNVGGIWLIEEDS